MQDADDGQYGSAAVRDVEVLAALSRRIHFGESPLRACLSAQGFKIRAAQEPRTQRPHPHAAYPSLRLSAGMFVSESKFRSDPASFIPHILNPNRDALAGLITKPAVEAALLVRLAEKAKVYGQDMDRAAGAVKDPSGADARAEERKIEVEEVVRLYKAFVIPLTKEVEVSIAGYVDPDRGLESARGSCKASRRIEALADQSRPWVPPSTPRDARHAVLLPVSLCDKRACARSERYETDLPHFISRLA